MSKRLLIAVVLLATATTPLSAETLREALVKAYQTNPTLTGARAGQRATDEGVPLARARGLPGVTSTVNYSEFLE